MVGWHGWRKPVAAPKNIQCATPTERDRNFPDWKSELEPWFDQARRMLGVIENPYFSPSDRAMKDVADEMGVGHTFQMAPVGIFFGEGQGIKSADPFFGGVGPERSGCQQCGACMTGCQFNAKNTLPKNYLGLAESAGIYVALGLRGSLVEVKRQPNSPRLPRTVTDESTFCIVKAITVR